MKESLSIGDSVEELLLLISGYNHRYNGGDSVDDGSALIKIANKLWISQQLPVNKEYVDSLSSQQVDIEVMDGNNMEPKAAAKRVNDWCATNTGDLIKHIVDAGDLQDFRIIITNAIYFKAKFKKQFDAKRTKKDVPFYSDETRKHEVSKVQMMVSEETQFHHALGVLDRYDVVKLYYQHSNISLVLAVPTNSTNSNASLFTTEHIIALNEKKAWKFSKVKLFVPKFKYEYRTELKAILKQMGITDAFDPTKANFSKIVATEAKEPNVYISNVLHKAVIEVDEKGTEAAAVTAITLMRSMSLTPQITQIRFDHPFSFFIFDEDTQLTLFAGEFRGK
jgi:serine protease inhibitor